MHADDWEEKRKEGRKQKGVEKREKTICHGRRKRIRGRGDRKPARIRIISHTAGADGAIPQCDLRFKQGGRGTRRRRWRTRTPKKEDKGEN